MIARKVEPKPKDKDTTLVKIMFGVLAVPIAFLTVESLVTENVRSIIEVLTLPFFWLLTAFAFYAIPKIDEKN